MVGEAVGGLAVADNHAVSPVAEEAGQRDAAPAQADDQRALHSRAMAAEASAAAAPTVQKTASMRPSDHPSS